MICRMTCMYEPDDLTETRMELLAAVSTDSDLYLAKVASTTFYHINIWDQIWVLEFELLPPRCPETAGTSQMRSSLGYTSETSGCFVTICFCLCLQNNKTNLFLNPRDTHWRPMSVCSCDNFNSRNSTYKNGIFFPIVSF